VSVQLSAPFTVTRYTLRHGFSHKHHVLRIWNLEASIDGRQWTVLREHVNDTGLPESGFSTCSWDVDAEGQAFTHFRVHLTGVTSSGDHRLTCSGLELYGQCGGGGRVAHGMVMPPTLPVLGWVAATLAPPPRPSTPHPFQTSHIVPAITPTHTHMQIPAGATMGEIAAAHAARVEQAEQARDQLEVAHAAEVAELTAAVEMAQAR
jgi:hypothetical protein